MARHEVQIGDDIVVAGQLFVVTHLKLELGQPPRLTVEPAISFMEVPT